MKDDVEKVKLFLKTRKYIILATNPSWREWDPIRNEFYPNREYFNYTDEAEKCVEYLQKKYPHESYRIVYYQKNNLLIYKEFMK